MLQYILECISFQLVFLIIYDLFLKRETFFQWNRLYLIGTYLISMVLPWIKIEAMKTTVPEAFQTYPEFLWNTNDVAVTTIAIEETSFSISWEYALLFGGMFLATLFFGYKLYQIFALKRKGEVHYFKDFTRVIVSNSSIAFSFFKSIFLGDKVIEKEHQSIVQHELVHIRQRHSYDLMFFELMRIVGWFNPLVYVYQSRVSELHEFIADAHVAKTHKREQYQQLLSEVFQTQNISFINQFFKTSLIKKRIVMLQRNQSKKIWQLKYLLMVPVVLGMLAYTSAEKNSPLDKSNTEIQTPEDVKLISEIENEIEQQINELGDLTKVYFGFVKQIRTKENQVLTKRNYFKKSLLQERYFNIIKVEFGDDVEPQPTFKMPLPSSARYENYVHRIKAFQILDKNLKYSIGAYKQDILLIEKSATYPDETYIFEVDDVKDLTGKELLKFNTKLSEIFEKTESDYANMVLTDNIYAFKIEKGTNTELEEHLRELNFPMNEVILVKNIENLSKKEEEEIFNRLKIISALSSNWELLVTDKESYIKFLPSTGGSYITGPNGEAIQARQILNYKPSNQDLDSGFNQRYDNAVKQYNQLVEERKRLLKSTNERNPIIINLDAQLRGMKESLNKAKSARVSIEKRNPKEQYAMLLKEREQLLKSTNEKNPIIVNLDEQIKGLRKAISQVGETIPFASVDEVPVFPGCENDDDKRGCFYENMREHIRKNFRYPKEAHKQGFQGRVAVMFIMNTEGGLSNVKVRGPHKLLEEEAVRIISRLPKFKPGVHEGKDANVAFSIPITFKLSGNDNEVKQTNYGAGIDVPFAVVDEVPIFPGCEDEENRRACFNKMMQKHISKNFNYPLEAQEKGIQGRVSIMFTVSEDGTIQKVRMRGPNVLLEKEAARIISLLPKMTPGKQNDKAVNVPFSIPITFKLESDVKDLDSMNLGLSFSTDPIYFIDGQESSKEKLSMLSPNDIESMNVLKGESAKITYGEKGKNGVIVVTTKKAKELDSDNQEPLTFRIRGDEGKSPLVFIDGEISSQEEMKKMDENDIAEIKVTKREFAIKEYGEKGKNGVVKILTKKFFNSSPKLAKVHTQITQLRKERSKLLDMLTEDNLLLDDNPTIKQLDTQIDALQKEEDKLVTEILNKN